VFAEENVVDKVRPLYCGTMLLKIETAAAEIQNADSSRLKNTREALEEKNITKRNEKKIASDQFKADSIAATGYLSDLLTIYKDASCDMDMALIHMYCSDNLDKKCNWAYHRK
jgi:hypothetical protein